MPNKGRKQPILKREKGITRYFEGQGSADRSGPIARNVRLAYYFGGPQMNRSPENVAPGELQRILGVTFGIAVTIGGMIGLGILRTPGEVTDQLRDPLLILLVWALGALYALCGVFSVAELGTSVPKAGGWYTYARLAFGDYPGFAVAWMDWIGYPATLAMGAIVIAEYTGKLFPVLAEHIVSVAIAVMVLLTAINWLGLRSGSRLQELLSFLKAAALLIIVIAGFVWGTPAGNSSAHIQAATPISLLTAIVISLQAVIFTYDGWYAAIYFSEENADPGRSLPKAMISSIIAVAAIYLLVNAALVYALPISDLGSSTLPMADLASQVLGDYGEKIMVLLALITVLSLQNANLLTAPRIMYAVSRDGMLPHLASKVNKGGTPSVALLFVSAVTIPVIVSGSFGVLLAVTAFLFMLLYISGFASVFVLRRKFPDLSRPYKAWGYPWTTLVILIGSIIFLVAALISDTVNSLWALGIAAASYPCYRIVKWFEHRTLS